MRPFAIHEMKSTRACSLLVKKKKKKKKRFSLVIFKAKGVKKFSGDISYLTYKRNNEDVSEHLDYIDFISKPLLNPTAPLNHTL